jgi:hypothetical protein
VLGALSACSDGTSEQPIAARVADELAPAGIGENLLLHENRDESTVAAFANLGPDSLLADGRIWEIRRKDRLIGTLQISTVLPEVDLYDVDERDRIAQQVIPGQLTRLRVEGVEVYAAENGDKALYVWFGENVFEIMQIKDTRLEGKFESLLAAVLTHQSTVDAWKPLVS